MKRTIRAIMAVAVVAAVSITHGFSLPNVGTGTEPNQWTRNMSGVLAAAKTTGYPIFLAMINDSSAGEGCSHCKEFVERTLNVSEFAAIVRDYKFYLVLLNVWGADTGASQPSAGGVSSDVFFHYFYKYTSDGAYPCVAVIRSDGTKYKGWGYSTNPGTSGPILHQFIRTAISDLSAKDTDFSLAGESGNTVTVQLGDTGVQPGTWTGVITRSGGSGATGSVGISLSGANAAQYSVNPASLAWDANDGSKTFTVTGPSSNDGGLVSDTITVSIQASGFDGSDVSYGVSSQTVTFKDSRVKQSLAEFAAASGGLEGLASPDGVWYVPSSGGNALETLTTTGSTLEFTATVGGILTVGVGANNPGLFEVSAKSETYDLVAGQEMRFGVAPGQKIAFKGTVREAEEAVSLGFSKFSFAPLSVTLKAPADGMQISYGDVLADKAWVNLDWAASLDGCSFAVSCGGVNVDMGSATSANAIDLGFVTLDPATKSYTWQVTATYAREDIIGTATGTAESSFTVVALPSFGSLPTAVTAYKSVGAWLDFSVSAIGAGTLTYSATGLPRGMKIDPNTGVITGKPLRMGSSSVTVTAKNGYGEVSTSFTLSVAKLPNVYTKATYACFRFSDAGDVEACAEVKIKTSGKWTAKFTEGGRTTSLKGLLTSLRDGSFAVDSGNALNITFDSTSGIWEGTSNGRKVYGKAVTRADAQWKGVWNSGVRTSSSSTLGGWVTAKVANSGQVTFTGSIANQARITGRGCSAVFPASFVSANLPKWAGHGDVRFACMGKVDGGYALCADGSLGGSFKFKSVAYDRVEGSKWTGGSVAALNGTAFKATGGGNVEIPVVVKGNKMSAGRNSFKARISAMAKTGRVNVSYKNGGNCKASGVLYLANGKLKAAGGGRVGQEALAFVIE